MNELLMINRNGRVMTDSRSVAEITNKRHDHLIRDIETFIRVIDQNPNLGADEFFIEGFYESGTGKRYKLYYLTKKGCDMVAHKMTGEKGILFTAAYVTKFDEMEKSFEPKVLTEKEQIIASMQLTLEATKEICAVKKDVDELKVAVKEKMTLDYGQQQVMLRTKNMRVEKFWKQNPHLQLTLTKKMVHASAWRDLKDAFNVASYRDIRQSDFQEAVNYLNAWRPRTTWLDMNA